MPHPQVTVAVEGRHQIVDGMRRVAGVLKPLNRAQDRLPPDQKGRAHFGTDRARRVGIGDHAVQCEADQQHDANEADQTEPKRHGLSPNVACPNPQDATAGNRCIPGSRKRFCHSGREDFPRKSGRRVDLSSGLMASVADEADELSVWLKTMCVIKVLLVTPAEAGVQCSRSDLDDWIPAFAGMTRSLRPSHDPFWVGL